MSGEQRRCCVADHQSFHSRPIPQSARVRWISRVRLRTSRIESLVQCTTDQRTAGREFNLRLKREHDTNQGWDED